MRNFVPPLRSYAPLSVGVTLCVAPAFFFIRFSLFIFAGFLALGKKICSIHTQMDTFGTGICEAQVKMPKIFSLKCC